MSKNVLIAPALDYRLTNGLHSVSGGRPTYSSPADGRHFDRGDIVFTHPIQALHTNFFLKAWEHGKFRGDRQLPTRAPVSGTYFLNSDGRYGPPSGSDTYDIEDAKKNNALAQTFDEAQRGSKPFAFVALTEAFNCPSGLSVHHEFFDTLEENYSLIEGWRSKSGTYSYNRDFWEILAAEKERMSETSCVLIENAM